MSLLRGPLGCALLRRVGLAASRPPHRSATSQAPPLTGVAPPRTGAAPPLTGVAPPPSGDLPPPTAAVPDFGDTRVAFRSKSNWQLLRAFLVYSLCSVDMLVDHNKEILRWSERLLGHRLFAALMKATVYGQFVGGEDRADIGPTVRAHAQHGVGSILDYSVEEDLSHDDAQSQEMSSCSSQAETEGTASLRSPQFVPHREFGDRRDHVVSARTYIYRDEHRCDLHVDTFLKSIEAAADSSGDGFAAIKLTALGRPQFLMQFSEVLVKWKDFFLSMAEEHGQASSSALKKQLLLPQLQESLSRLGIGTRDECGEWFTVMDRDGSGAVDLLEWSRLIDAHTRISKLMVVPNRQTGCVEPLMMSFTDEEERQMKRMLKRMDILATAAVQRGVRLMVDAEQSYFQPAISRLSLEMMRTFNGQRPAIFNTYQGYLKGAYDDLSVDLECARREGWCLGVKLVRGAYMEQERQRAQQVGYPDPVNKTYADTTAMYHRCLDLLLRDVAAGGRAAIMVASHNESTVRHTLHRMMELNVSPSGGRVYFGQLLGMCDHISFALGEAGYPVYKYVPYGPVREVLPYLCRRAHENRSVLRGGGGAALERSLVAREMRRRLMATLLSLVGAGKQHKHTATTTHSNVQQ